MYDSGHPTFSLPFDVGKGVPGRHVIDNNDSMCSSVICGSDCPKPFLACCVPNLEFDPLTVDFNGPNFKVNTDGCDVVAREHVVSKSHQQGALADARIANDEELEQVIMITMMMRSHFAVLCLLLHVPPGV